LSRKVRVEHVFRKPFKGPLINLRIFKTS